jgi:hypothetical protein
MISLSFSLFPCRDRGSFVTKGIHRGASYIFSDSSVQGGER